MQSPSKNSPEIAGVRQSFASLLSFELRMHWGKNLTDSMDPLPAKIVQSEILHRYQQSCLSFAAGPAARLVLPQPVSRTRAGTLGERVRSR